MNRFSGRLAAGVRPSPEELTDVSSSPTNARNRHRTDDPQADPAYQRRGCLDRRSSPHPGQPMRELVRLPDRPPVPKPIPPSPHRRTGLLPEVALHTFRDELGDRVVRCYAQMYVTPAVVRITTEGGEVRRGWSSPQALQFVPAAGPAPEEPLIRWNDLPTITD